MIVEHSDKCLIDDQFKLHVTREIAASIFNVTTNSPWIKLNPSPELLQVYHVRLHRDYLIGLTLMGDLMVADRSDPQGRISIISQRIGRIKFIHYWSYLSAIIIISHDDKIYQLPITALISGSIDQLRRMGHNVASIIDLSGHDLIWLDHDNRVVCHNRKTVIGDLLNVNPLIIYRRLLVDLANIVYRLEPTFDGDRIVNLRPVKLFQAEGYNIFDITEYPSPDYISTIDRYGVMRTYSNNKLIDTDDNINRFIRFTDRSVAIELTNGKVLDDKKLISDFKLFVMYGCYQDD